MSSREYPSRPLVGVGVLVKMKDKVLLVKRRYEPDKGLWALPGGLINLGETARNAAIREVYEETGIKISINRLIDVTDKIVLDENGKIRFHFVIIDYEGVPEGGAIRVSHEVEDVGWFGEDELKRMELSETTRELLVKEGLIKS